MPVLLKMSRNKMVSGQIACVRVYEWSSQVIRMTPDLVVALALIYLALFPAPACRRKCLATSMSLDFPAAESVCCRFYNRRKSGTSCSNKETFVYPNAAVALPIFTHQSRNEVIIHPKSLLI